MGRPTKEYQAFTRLTDRLVAVPYSVIEKRMAEHREKASQNPRRPGSKPRVKPPSATATDEESGNG